MVVAVIFAGGVGRRMKSDEVPKQFIEVDGKPIIIRTLEHFDRNQEVDHIVISCLESKIPELQQLIEKFRLTKVVSIVKGGATGHESIHNGLVEAAGICGDDDIVLICDGVRPRITETLISNTIKEAKEYGSAVPVTPSIDSVLQSQDGIYCKKNYSRSEMYITQAPQGYTMKKIMDAHDEAAMRQLNPTSSCELLIELGQDVHIFIGERANIKVTTPEDLEILRSHYYYDHYKTFAKEEFEYGD